MRILFLLLSLSISFSTYAVDDVETSVSESQKEIARKDLEESLKEPPVISPELLVDKLQKIKILNARVIDSKRGRIWCGRSMTYEISVSHPVDPDKDWTLVLAHYRPRSWQSVSKEDKKTVIVTPATGDGDFVEKSYSWSLCDWKKMEVIRVVSWQGDGGVNRKRGNLQSEIEYMYKNPQALSVKKHDRGAILNIAAIAVASKFADQKNRDLKPGRPLGILGNSVGGIASAMALSFIPRITAGVLIVAGAPLNEVIARSGEKSLQALRQLRLKLLNLETVDQYSEILKDHVLLDPYLMTEKVAGKSVLAVTAGEDTTVPSEYQFSYVKKLKDTGVSVKELHLPNKDHVGAITSTLFSVSRMNQIGDFLNSSIQ